MRRSSSTVEELYAEALALAQRGKILATHARDRAEARQCFSDAIRIFNRLSIVESAAKRELIQDVVRELRERVARLDDPLEEESVDDMLAKAMEIHASAKQQEESGDRAQAIELYISAGEWYMKAFTAFGPDAASAKEAVREQIEYVIDHVSQLQTGRSTASVVLSPAPSTSAPDTPHVAEMDWPLAPEDSPLPTALPPTSSMAPQCPLEPAAPDATAWPLPPLASAPALQSSDLESSASTAETGGTFAWPLPPGFDATLETFDWPQPPALAAAPQIQPPKRHSFRQNTKAPPLSSSRASSSEQLLAAHPHPPPPTLRQSSSRSTVDVDDADEPAVYSPSELDVLRRSSQINGHVFVPWLDDLDAHENFRSVNLFVDPDGTVPLSAKQIRKGATWMRPDEYAQLCAQIPVMIDSICPQVVKQDIVTDCSFVASLCIAAAYEQRFQKRLITNIIFPVDARTRQPMYNPAGKYIVKLWANGVPRKVVIDDLLPVNPQTRELLCSCTTRRNELWVSLIEKAYLKLCGGYDYPGGNSGIDLFALTGWIPERIPIVDLASDAAREDRIWEQLKSAFHFGDCIITMTTGDIGRDEAIEIGLVPMHVYAVLNVYETTEFDESTGETKKLRLLHVKNPWRKLSWKGPYSNSDLKTWQGAVGDELRVYQRQYYSLDDSTTQAKSAVTDDGLFWIDLSSVKQRFESLYLNWNPELFPHKYAIHEHWPVDLGPANDSTTLAYNPQYSLRFIRRRSESVNNANARVERTHASSSVWVLLTRHVSKVERDTDNEMQQFLTLHAYRNTNGRRVFYNQDAMYRGTYSNNPHTLVSLDVDFTDDDPEPTFTLVASQYEKFAPLDFTLSVFSTTPFVCRPVPHLDAEPNSIVIQGEWGAATAGGRPFFSTFMDNPQYHVQLHTTSLCGVWVFLETAGDSDVPVNLRLITHTQERVCGLPALSSDSPQTILSSGEYRPGFCFVELDETAVEAASESGCLDIVLALSTFEPATLAPFRLRILSDPPAAIVHVRELPTEGSEMETTTIRGQWDSQRGTAVGCASYGCYTFNPKYLVHVPEESYVFARLIPARGDSSSSLPSCNLSIYASTADGALLLSTNPKSSFRRATSDDGAYASGNPSGVVTPKHVVFPCGWYIIIPSTYEPQDAAFELRVYSSSRVSVRPLEK